ncbi:cocaine- and amphetamine-regulated transcript protein-like [Odontesthes bonariensis]
MGSWCAVLFYIIICALRLFCSFGHIQTEGYETKYLTFITSTEDNNAKQLIIDLHHVLERLQNSRFPALRKKHGYLPVCALRKGSRIGKLCDCFLPRTCNSFLHRCL